MIHGMPSCSCCGAEYRRSGCVRGYPCNCLTKLSKSCQVCGKCSEHCDCGVEDFPMQDGPPLPIELAKAVYQLYCSLYGNRQSFRRMRERGGFGYVEIKYMAQLRAKKLEKQKGNAE
jgi:hypothetical protein